MAFSPITLVMAGLFVVASVGATALGPLMDDGCSGFSDGMGLDEATNGANATTDGECATGPGPCPGGKVAPTPSGTPRPTGVVRFEIDNEARPVEVRFCLADPDGITRYDVTRKIATDATFILDVEVPVDAYSGGFQVDGNRMVSSYGNLDLDDCPDHAIKVPARVAIEYFGGTSAGTTNPRCIERPQHNTDNPLYPSGTQTREPPLIGLPNAQTLQTLATVLAVASGSILAGAALLRWDRLRWMLAFFFTRIRPPKALDHRLRDETQRLVQAQPGLRTEDIRKTLGLGHGQTAHHLRILMQSGLLEAVRISGSHHFYPAGRYDAQEKRRLALLNQSAARRLYDTIRKTDEADVSTLATKIGLSVAYTSRLAVRLATEGLVTRHRVGNRVVLRAEPDVQASDHQ